MQWTLRGPSSVDKVDVDDVSGGRLNKILHEVAHSLMWQRRPDGDKWHRSTASVISLIEVAR